MKRSEAGPERAQAAPEAPGARAAWSAPDASLPLGPLVWVLIVGGGLALGGSFLVRGHTVLAILSQTLIFLPTVVILEQLYPLRAGHGVLASGRIWLQDVGHWLLAHQITGALRTLLCVGLAAWLGSWAGARFGLGLWPESWPYAAQVVLVILAGDFLMYWRHRWSHELGAFWPAHVVHHGIDRLNVLRGARAHAVEVLFEGLVVFGPLAASGAPFELILWYPVLYNLTGITAHSNLEYAMPAFLHRWIQTPAIHRIHHARDYTLSNSNYAFCFTFWDRLFGTYTEPRQGVHPEIGIDRNPLPPHFVGEVLAPFALGRAGRASDRSDAIMPSLG